MKLDNIKAVVFDIDGVITDGRKYILNDNEIKCISLKDLDAIGLLKSEGYILGAITGEDTRFSQELKAKFNLDFFILGCKKKKEAMSQIKEEYRLHDSEICYIGDGKYDIDVLNKVGLAVCPADAIDEVKVVSDIMLKRKGGEGCLSEVYTILKGRNTTQQESFIDVSDIIVKRMDEHKSVLQQVIGDAHYLKSLTAISERMIECYHDGKKVLFCGNGGSAADAQHLAAELVSRFYRERRALSAEALNVNTSVITAIANDYSYDRIFAREVEAKGQEGDVLVGITTSGKSSNIIEAFKVAKKRRMQTVLFTGELTGAEKILQYTDYMLSVPSKDTPRIQEVHILSGHIMCEIIEKRIADEEE